jgi:hypothetical protein
MAAKPEAKWSGYKIPEAIQTVLATHDCAIRALAKHQLDLLLQFSELKAAQETNTAPGMCHLYKDVSRLTDDELEILKHAILLEEDHRDAVRATQEAEYQKEAKAEQEEQA